MSGARRESRSEQSSRAQADQPALAPMRVGQLWDAPLGDRVVRWRVTWVGVKKAKLSAQLDYGWANVTVWIDRYVDNPDNRLVVINAGGAS